MGYGQNNQNQERQAFSLLELNNRVKGVILNAFPETCWVRAEMSDVRTNAASGHCYLEFIEKNAITGQLVAKARGSIWAKTFRMLKPYFEMETGQIFASGLKVLVKVSIEFHELYGYSLTVLDIEKFAKAAHAHGVPLIVDNTFATPVNCRPFEWGADIVTHSTTKYMDGHAMALGGAIVDSGNFDWSAYPDKFPGLCTPDESYHGITYAEKFGKEGAFITKCTSQLMRDLGSIQAPQNAFILNLGLESLHVRMPRHVENGQAVAEFLEQHPKVAYVNYPGLPSNKYYERAKKYMPDGGCGVVSFGLKGGREAASVFMQNLKLGAIETHVADARTCCLNPATSTHRQMNDEQLKEAGVPAELIRISLGLEDKEDLIADLEAVLK